MEVSWIFSCCLVFSQMWDLSWSQQSNVGMDPQSAAVAAHYTAGEKPVTVTAVLSHSHSTQNEPSTNTGHLLTGPTTLQTQNPVQTSGVSPSSPARDPAGPRFHAGSFLGGMMVAFVITVVAALVYRLTCSRQTVQYQAIVEHDAVI